jgi:hypothetical protein
MKMRPETAVALGSLVAASLSACSTTALTPGNHAAPLLVQVENISDARPQSGLQDAAVVYEYLTEGGITRFSVIYTSPPKGRVGPIRSARLVTIALAKTYGAVLVFSGGSEYIKSQIQAAGIQHVDENGANGDLFRDKSRSAPHNLYSDGSHLSDIANHASAPSVTWSLWDRASADSVSGGRPVSRATVPLSNTETPTFTYDPSVHGWKRTEPDTGSFIEADANAPLVVSTLIVQQVSIKPSSEVEDVNGQHGVDHDITSGGKAQVFSFGREFDATWTQGASGPPSFSVGDHPAPIASGLVWICLVPTGGTAA